MRFVKRVKNNYCLYCAARVMRKGFENDCFRGLREKKKLSSFYVGRQRCLSRLTLRFDWLTWLNKEMPEVVMYKAEETRGADNDERSSSLSVQIWRL